MAHTDLVLEGATCPSYRRTPWPGPSFLGERGLHGEMLRWGCRRGYSGGKEPGVTAEITVSDSRSIREEFFATDGAPMDTDKRRSQFLFFIGGHRCPIRG